MKVLDAQKINDVSTLDFERGEILNIYKPEGWTSFDVVKEIRNILRVKKVGHAGTLDPFAVGVLLICTGRATKKVSELVNFEKEYVATLELGKVTDTLDRTGAILEENAPSHIEINELETICNSFIGEIYQTPPMYSAVKINGQRLYKLARQGEVVDREPRRVKIHEINILKFENPFITLKVICTKGTYIRTLAYDIGEKSTYGACLNNLTRTRIGPYKIENAYSIPDFARLIEFH